MGQMVRISRLKASCIGAGLGLGLALMPAAAMAQSYRFTNVEIDGNQRVEDATILAYAGIGRGQAVSGGQLNAAYQSILNTGLFESVEIVPRGSKLLIIVTEYPTISRINIEGNRRLKDDDLEKLLQSRARRVYSPATAEADANAIADAYRQAGRLAAEVTPRIIPRSDNRVDLVFEVVEGKVSETERISFVGNRSYTDRRLRRVLESKQAGVFRQIVRADTFLADRLQFDEQVLKDFYNSRGYIDFAVLDTTAEFSRERNAYFITMNVREGQQYRFGEITTATDLTEIDPDLYLKANKIKDGDVYNPAAIENTIARMERLALQERRSFVRIEPRVVRNDAELKLDVEFAIVRGPRMFVERIDIEGNTTTLDRVVRAQFDTVEGDPFNPRAIRQAAERIRALGFFAKAEVQARDGTAGDQVIVDVDVEEKPTGSLSFGASFGTDEGVAFTFGLSERNFLGRGQYLAFNVSTGEGNQSYKLDFREPNLLGRDVGGGLYFNFAETEGRNGEYDTTALTFEPSLSFPVSERGNLRVSLNFEQNEILNAGSAAQLIQDEAGLGQQTAFGLGYDYTWDSRSTGLNPDAGVRVSLGQRLMVAGDAQYVKTQAGVRGETLLPQYDITLRARADIGALHAMSGTTTVLDRFGLSSRQMRGFVGNSVGPRDLVADEALGGNYYFSAGVEAQFPLGLPEEYGIEGGVFWDVGSVWGLDKQPSAGAAIDDSFALRSSIGVSLFWTTAIGPLRFNFSTPLAKEDYDKDRGFNFTIATSF
jgi:outer membrane protein insertion porin family